MRRSKLLVPAAIAMLAGLSTVSGPAAAVSTTKPPAPKPPVIPEPWNPPFACNQQSNFGIEGCIERDIDSKDKRVVAEIRLLFRLVYDDASRRDLVNAQSAWLAYRTADCTSQSDEYEGGTEQPVAYLACLAVDDQSRSADLKGFYSVLVQDQPNPPKFP